MTTTTEAGGMEAAAIAMWQEESRRATGSPRRIPWGEEGEQTKDLWRGLARAALATARPDESLRPLDEAQIVEALAQHLHDEEFEDRGNGWTWPEHPDDEGYRGRPQDGRGSGWVTITPSDIQALRRESAVRILTRVRQLLRHPPQTAGVPLGPITEDMIEAACRAAGGAEWPLADLDMQTRHPLDHGRTCAVWESYRYLIEPALKAALDRAAAPQSEEAE